MNTTKLAVVLLLAACAAVASFLAGSAHRAGRAPCYQLRPTRRSTSAGSTTPTPFANASRRWTAGRSATPPLRGRLGRPGRCLPLGSSPHGHRRRLPARDQKSVGCCVGFATASAIEYLLCAQIAERADEATATSHRKSSMAVRASRSAAAAFAAMDRSVRGPRSGSRIMAWCRAAFTARYDLRRYDEARCRTSAARASPTDSNALAKDAPGAERGPRAIVGGVPRGAFAIGYPVVVCSDQGFTMERDADGFCNPKGTWYHAMAVIGVRGGEAAGRVPAELLGAERPQRPACPGRCPACGFWVDAADPRPDAEAGRFVVVQPGGGVSAWQWRSEGGS